MNNNLNSPIILIEGKYSEKDLDRLKKENKIWKINDVYKSQLEELFEILNPSILHTQDFQKKLYSIHLPKKLLGLQHVDILLRA